MKDNIPATFPDPLNPNSQEDVARSAIDKAGTSGKRTSGRPERVMAVLGRGRSVVVIGRNLDLDAWLGILSGAVAKGRRAKSCGLTLEGFLKMLRDFTER